MRVAITLAGVLAAVALAVPAAQAQDPPPGECFTGFCGTPDNRGGGCGCGCGCAILVANTDLGVTYSTSDDYDGDGFEADFDNCPFIQNRDQTDSDGDGIGDACDNAPSVSNPDQSDIDGNGKGDVIDPDIDGDGIPNLADNCPRVYNPTQHKTMAESTLGDACNLDDDLDGMMDAEDPCPKVPGSVAISGKACDDDEDLDGFADSVDNCPGISNQDQSDLNRDGKGDLCDLDMDGDGIPNVMDNAVKVFNPDQIDSDHDGIGDVADNEFCFVFDQKNKTACLNPLDTFKIGATGVNPRETEDITGSKVTLILFANRTDTPIEYTWTVSKAPGGSSATVQGSVGKVVTTIPGTMQYAYAIDGNNVAPTFTPDEPGAYELKVVAKLVFPDDVFPGGPAVASYNVALVAGGQSQAAGCSTTGGEAPLVSVLAMLAGLLVMRRRRS